MIYNDIMQRKCRDMELDIEVKRRSFSAFHWHAGQIERIQVDNKAAKWKSGSPTDFNNTGLETW